MSDYQSDLLLLLKYAEGGLSAAQAIAARRRLEDPVMRRRWQKLKQACAPDFLATQDARSPNTIPAETLAAFLDRDLEPDEARRIEAKCWDSLPALAEVVSSFRFRQSGEAETVSSRLSERLLGFMPSNGTVVNVPTQPAQPILPVAVAVDRQPTTEEVDVAEKTSLARKLREQRRGGNRWLLLASAVAVVVVAAVAVIVAVSSKPEREIVDPNGDDSGKSTKPAPEIKDNPLVKTESNEPPLDKPPTPPDDPPGPGVIVEGSDPGPPLPNPLLDPLDEPAPPVPAPQEKPLRFEVVGRNGAVIVRDDRADIWYGVNSAQIPTAPKTFATMPGSWVDLKPHDGRDFQLSMSDDTQVNVTTSDVGEGPEIHVGISRGRATIHRLPTDRDVEIRWGKQRVAVRARQAGSSIAVDRRGKQPRFAVPTGEVMVAGQIIAHDEEALWTGLGISAARQVDAKWYNEKPKPSRMPPSLQTELLVSNNVYEQLSKWRTSPNSRVREVAVQWTLATVPGHALFEMMNAVDPQVRAAAIDWIMATPENDSRLRRMWNQFRTDAGLDQTQGGPLTNWLIAIHRQQPGNDGTARQIIAGLNSDHIAVRELSNFLLQSSYADWLKQRRISILYKPELPPAERLEMMRMWSRVVQEKRAAARPATRTRPANQAAQQPNNPNVATNGNRTNQFRAGTIQPARTSRPARNSGQPR